MTDLKLIVELGKRVKSPKDLRWLEADTQTYVNIAANSADIMAQKLLDIETMCDEAGKHINVEAVMEILRRVK